MALVNLPACLNNPCRKPGNSSNIQKGVGLSLALKSKCLKSEEMPLLWGRKNLCRGDRQGLYQKCWIFALRHKSRTLLKAAILPGKTHPGQ
jgi:hypothetical protein